MFALILPWFVLCLTCWSSPCQGKVHHSSFDIGIVVDRSGSIGKNNLEKVKSFAKEILSQFSITPSHTKVAVVSFAKKPVLEHRLDETVNREWVKDRLDNIVYHGGHTNLKGALVLLHKHFRNNSYSNRKKIVFVFTDGKASRGSSPHTILKYYHGTGIESHIFGVGKELRYRGLNRLVSRLHSAKWHRVPPIEEQKRFLQYLTDSKKSYTSCRGEGYVRDECDRLCKCVDGQKTDCYRVRKEFNEMSYNERVRFVKAFKTLANTEKFRKRYEEITKIHVTYFCKGVHYGDQFLPWHRWYIWKYENLLREVDCRITVPYWDWSYWSKNVWSSKYIWKTGPDGLGGNGTTENFLCVETGPFSVDKFEMPSYYNTTRVYNRMLHCGQRYNILAGYKGKPTSCLKRFFNGRPPNSVNVRRLLHLKPENFTGFATHIIVNYHNLMHSNVGGDMCTPYASSDPVFFMHHNFLDKIWYLWGSISAKHLQASRTKNFKLLNSNYHANDFLNGHHLPKKVRMAFSSFGQHKRGQSLEDLDTVDNGIAEHLLVKNSSGNCYVKNLASEKQKAAIDEFVSNKDFKYNPLLLDHLDEYNLPDS